MIYEDDIDRIDLKENTLTRRFLGEDSTIILSISDSEKKQLFQLMKKYSVWTVDKADLKTHRKMLEWWMQGGANAELPQFASLLEAAASGELPGTHERP